MERTPYTTRPPPHTQDTDHGGQCFHTIRRSSESYIRHCCHCLLRAFSRDAFMATTSTHPSICPLLLFTSICLGVVQPCEMHTESEHYHGRLICSVVLFVLTSRTIRRRRSQSLNGYNGTQNAPDNICRLLLPYYFAFCRLARGLPLHAAQIAVFVSRLSRAQPRITAIRFCNSKRDNTTHSPPDAPRNIRRNGQAQQAPAEYAPPP